jgi:hypothetical protein
MPHLREKEEVPREKASNIHLEKEEPPSDKLETGNPLFFQDLEGYIFSGSLFDGAE